jgi:hypothetical protein
MRQIPLHRPRQAVLDQPRWAMKRESRERPPSQVFVQACVGIRGAVTAEAAKLGHSLGDAPTNAKPGAVHVVFAAEDQPISKGGMPRGSARG